MKYFVILLIATPLLFAPCLCGASALVFKAKVDPKFSRYRHLFATPAGLILALENGGFTFSHSGRIYIYSLKHLELERNNSVPFSKATVKFIGSDKFVYSYLVSVDWSVGIVAKRFDIQVELNSKELEQGNVTLGLRMPLSFLAPQKLKGYVEGKLESFLNIRIQEALLAYLEKVERRSRPERASPILETILLDAYNVPRKFLEEPLSVNRLLVGHLVLWLAIAPLLLASVLFWMSAFRRKPA